MEIFVEAGRGHAAGRLRPLQRRRGRAARRRRGLDLDRDGEPPGKFGNKDAKLYLGSPATVAASAIAGKIVDAARRRSAPQRGNTVSDNIWVTRGRCHKFGDNVPHGGGIVPGWVLAGRVVEAEKIIPHLFEDIAPGFHERCKPGDIIVAGKNFGMSPKMNGFVAMQALGLGLICESMPFLAYRAAVGVGLRVMSACEGVTEICETGDDIELDLPARAVHQSHAQHRTRVSADPGDAAGADRGRRQHRMAEALVGDPQQHRAVGLGRAGFALRSSSARHDR